MDPIGGGNMTTIDVSSDLKRRVISLVVFAIFVISLIELFASEFVPIPDDWFVPIVFLCLVLLIEMISDLYSIEEKVDLVVEESGYSKVDMYYNYADYFRALSTGLKAADESVHLTHVRHQSPDDFDSQEVDDWFKEVQQWCDRNPSAPVRRITTLSNENMLEWGETLEKYTNEKSNFYIKTIDWELEFPMVNIVIFDEEEVYLTLTSDTAEQTKGVRVRDPEMARAYVEYFNYMWRCSKDLDDRLEELRSGEEVNDIQEKSMNN